MRHVAAFAVQAVDTTGAGDAFIGSLACSLSMGCEESESIARASLYAALSTMRAGTQSSFATQQQFEAAWSDRRNRFIPPAER
jgi:ribokinase